METRGRTLDWRHPAARKAGQVEIDARRSQAGLSRAETGVIVSRLTWPQALTAMRRRIVSHVSPSGQAVLAATAKATPIPAGALSVVDEDLVDALQEHFAHRLLARARDRLARLDPRLSARTRVTWVQAGGLGGLVMALVAVALTAPAAASALAGVIAIAGFVAILAYRALALIDPPAPPAPRPLPLAERDLPVYTIIVPLHDEEHMISPLLRALAAIDYPADRLDIKLVLERSDRATAQALARQRLPAHVEVLSVPYALPQTKPKALNYALEFARGQLLTVYDAEDIPDPRQLRLAAATFAAGDASLACVQARLAFFNPNENWLTRQFAIEYAVLFDLWLPTLAALRLPLPLGGSSNHFRTADLRAVGGWDAWNVTEDADLALRLSRAGRAIGVIASTTFEEANCRFGNWLMQRARWLKGWMQTWLVHARRPRLAWTQLGPGRFLAMHVLMASMVIPALAHPLLMAHFLWSLASGRLLPPAPGLFAAAGGGASLAILIGGYGFAMLAGARALRRRRLARLVRSLPAVPIYWLLISAAAWLALWQLITGPFHWNKTRHGITAERR